AYQRAEHRKESAVIAGDRAVEFSFIRNTRESVEKIVVWHNDVGESDQSVIDAIQSHLSAAVSYRYARQQSALCVSERDEERTDAVILFFHDHFSKDCCHLSVTRRVPDEFL